MNTCRHIGFLLLLIFTCFHYNGLAQKNADLVEIEKIYHCFSQEKSTSTDTVALRQIVDSIAKENNTRKTEYATLFYFLTTKEGRQKEDARNYFKRFSAFFSSCHTPAVKALFKFYYGQFYFGLSEYAQAMDLMLEAVSELKNIGYDKTAVVDVPLYILSLYYYQFGSYRKSIEYGLLAEKYSSGDNSIGSSNTIGMAYQKLELYDSAIIHFKAVMDAAKKVHFDVWYSIAAGNLGRTYCLKGEYNKGIPLLLTDVQMGVNEEPVNSALSALYIMDAYMAQHRTDSAAYYISLARKIVTDKNLWNSEAFFLNRFSYYFYSQSAALNSLVGNYRLAYLELDTANKNKEIHDSRFDLKFLTASEKRIQGLEYQENLNLLDAQKKNERLQKVILIISLAAVVIIAILFQYWQRLERKKEKQLTAQKEANLLLKKEMAEQQLLDAHVQLNDLLKKFEERTSLKESLEANIEELARSSNGMPAHEQTSKILKELRDASLLTNEDWQLFQQKFEKVYDSFFAKLAHEVPGITPAEERMLALLKLKVSYRQMAQMLGISIESVRTAKYRLRKKLQSSDQRDLLVHLDD